MSLLKFKSCLKQEEGEGAALVLDAVTEGEGEGDELVISLSFQDMNEHDQRHQRHQRGGNLEPSGGYTSLA